MKQVWFDKKWGWYRMMLVLLFAGIALVGLWMAFLNPSSAMGTSEETEVSQHGEAFIHLAWGSFDPVRNLPVVPEDLKIAGYPFRDYGVYIVQFLGPVQDTWKQAVQEAGGQLGDYLPENAFIIRLDGAAKITVEKLPFVRWVGIYQPAYKFIAGALKNEYHSYRVITTPWVIRESLEKSLAKLGRITASDRRGFSVVFNESRIDEVAQLTDVLWLEPLYPMETLNDIAAAAIMSGTIAWGSGYTGAGQIVAVADTGLDTGITSTIHLDFKDRVIDIQSWPVIEVDYGGGCQTTNPGADDGPADTASGHGTHVSGSALGNGARSNGSFKGLAYQADLVFQALDQYTTWVTPTSNVCENKIQLSGIPNDVGELLEAAYQMGARIHNSSWGGGEFGQYDEMAAQFDDYVFNHPDFLAVTAAGNSGADRFPKGRPDGFVDENSIVSPAVAKNILAVGAIDNQRLSGGYAGTPWGSFINSQGQRLFPEPPTSVDLVSDEFDTLMALSSRGPTADGRIKPDLVAPGTSIISTRSSATTEDLWGGYDDYYVYSMGTSMASPLAAGAAALVRQYYAGAEGHANPSAALVKATLINTAVDIKGYIDRPRGDPNQEAARPIPNNHEGWGRIDVGAATDGGNRLFVDHLEGLSTSETAVYSYSVISGMPFKITLVWSDYPAAPYAGKTLVNDLDLLVTSPDGSTVYLGNVFGGGWAQSGGIKDSVNNVESVYVEMPTQGLWQIAVSGANIPKGPQPFALVVSGKINVDIGIRLGSNGGVMLSGQPFTSTITLTNYGAIPQNGIIFTNTITGGAVFDFLNPTCDSGLSTLENGFSCQAGSELAPGNVISYTVVLSIPVGMKGFVLSEAWITTSTGDNFPKNNSDNFLHIIDAKPPVYLPIIRQ